MHLQLHHLPWQMIKYLKVTQSTGSHKGLITIQDMAGAITENQLHLVPTAVAALWPLAVRAQTAAADSA